MSQMSHKSEVPHVIAASKQPRYWGLALLCAVWLALLSPKVIFGLPGGNDTRHLLPANSAAPAQTELQIAAGDTDPGMLNISPSQINVTAGRTQSFRLTDRQGHLLKDATWMVSDFTVAELDSVDPPRIAALTPGQVTVTAILGDQTVQAKVNVVRSPNLSSVRPTGSTSTSGSR